MIFVLALSLLLVACGDNKDSSKKGAKGTIDNPYTMDDVITITTTSWDGNRYIDGTIIGNNTFELSNFRIEEGELSGYADEPEKVSVLAFDVKCIETCYENGLGWLEKGGIYFDNFFDANMQTLDYTDVTDSYQKLSSDQVVYFPGTTYSMAYAMGKIDEGKVYAGDVDNYKIMRLSYVDKNLKDDSYVYIKIK